MTSNWVFKMKDKYLAEKRSRSESSERSARNMFLEQIKTPKSGRSTSCKPSLESSVENVTSKKSARFFNRNKSTTSNSPRSGRLNNRKSSLSDHHVVSPAVNVTSKKSVRFSNRTKSIASVVSPAVTSTLNHSTRLPNRAKSVEDVFRPQSPSKSLLKKPKKIPLRTKSVSFDRNPVIETSPTESFEI